MENRSAARHAQEPRYLSFFLWLLIVVLPFHEAVVQLWRPLGAWDDLTAAALGLCAWRQRRADKWPSRLGWLLACLAGVYLLSAIANHLPMGAVLASMRAFLPYTLAALAASQIPAERVPRYVAGMVGVGALAALYGVASFALFRLLVGTFLIIPQAPTPLHAFLLWPYRCGLYAAGWHLAGPFLNDNYFGMWLAALVCLAAGLLAFRPGGRRKWVWMSALALFLPALAWTGSRSAFVGFTCAVVLLAARLSRYAGLLLLLLLLLVPLWITPLDLRRYTDPIGTQGGRVESVRMAVSVLRQRPLLGKGPGTRGLADMHYAKIAYELGSMGLLVFLLLLGHLFSPAAAVPKCAPERLRLGIIAALVALAGGAVGGEVWEIPQLAHWFWMLAGFSEALGGGLRASAKLEAAPSEPGSSRLRAPV